MQPVVKGIHVQRLAADADNISVLGLGFQQLDIRVNRRHVFVVQRGGFREGPFVLFAVLQQVAFVFFQQQVVQLALFRRGNPVLAQALKNRVNLIQVDGHIAEAFPVICAAV